MNVIHENIFNKNIDRICALFAGEQLSNTRRSDPHFYELNADLRAAVATYTGAKLICETTRLESVPQNIFYLPSPT